MLSVYRQNLITRLAERDGSDLCQYCGVKVRRYFAADDMGPSDATVDHIIPKASGGTNVFENLCIACRLCNHRKGRLSVEEFLVLLFKKPHRVRPKRRRGVPYIYAPYEPRPGRGLPAPARGTFAAAIGRGEVNPDGTAYVKLRPRASAEEVAAWLRERGAAAGSRPAKP